MSLTTQIMPVLFIGHGSPMNAIESNTFTQAWADAASKVHKPEAILCISAHWYTDGSRVNDEAKPRLVYDMYGFPDPLYKVSYPAPGAPGPARRTKELVGLGTVIDNGWGIDHGTWSVLCHMFPEADIPVYQLSVDASKGAQAQYEIGRKLSALRESGVLILGSGNVVHNLARVNWDMMEGGYAWAEEFDGYIKQRILAGRFEDVINYQSAGESARTAFYTPDHFYPLLYVLGAARDGDEVSVFNDSCVMGSLSMTCYLFK